MTAISSRKSGSVTLVLTRNCVIYPPNCAFFFFFLNNPPPPEISPLPLPPPFRILGERGPAPRRFVADVSHELRTPLATLAAVADVLDEEAARLPEPAGRAARLVSQETLNLT